MKETIIYFYKTREEHGYMSNFARFPIALDGKLWPTSEHYYQAQKFTNLALQEQVRQAPNPKEAARIGRDINNPLRPDWDSIKDEVMRKVVLAKFEQHSDIRTKLISTGTSVLVERSDVDWYWGDGADHTGKNMLGKILMEIRKHFQYGGGF